VGLGFKKNKRREKTKRKRKRGTQSVEEDPRLGPVQRDGCPRLGSWPFGASEEGKKGKKEKR